MAPHRHNNSLPPPDDEFDEILRLANPNPTREGCPPRSDLIAMARRELPLGDPKHDHLLHCSPCYVEVRAFQHALRDRRVLGLTRRSWLATAAAACLMAVAGGWYFFPTGVRETQTAALQVELDLRPYTVTRSQQAARDVTPLTLPRATVTLTLFLALGFEPGAYDVAIIDAEPRALTSATGQAEIQDFVTTLQVPLDLTSIEAGTYDLAVRREGETWRVFPVRVQ